MKIYKIDRDELTPEDNIMPLNDGDKIIISKNVRQVFHKCCDCGLVHRWHIKSINGRIEIITRRINK